MPAAVAGHHKPFTGHAGRIFLENRIQGLILKVETCWALVGPLGAGGRAMFFLFVRFFVVVRPKVGILIKQPLFTVDHYPIGVLLQRFTRLAFSLSRLSS